METNKHIQKQCLIYRSDNSTYLNVTDDIAGVWEDDFGDVSGVGDQGQDGIAQLATFRLMNSYNKNYNPKVFYFEKTYCQEDIVGDGVTKAFTLSNDYVYRGSCTVFSVSSGVFVANIAVTTDYNTGVSTATFNKAIPSGVTVTVQYQYYDNTTQNTINWFSGSEDALLSSDRIVKFKVRKGDLQYKQQVITGTGASRYSITATTGDRIVTKVTVFDGNSTFLADYTNEISVDESTDEFVFNRAIAVGEEVTVQYQYNDGTWRTRFVGLIGASREFDEFGVTVTAQDYSKKLQRAKIIFNEDGEIVSKVMPENVRIYGTSTEVRIYDANVTNVPLFPVITVDTGQDLTSILANGQTVKLLKNGVYYSGIITSLATTSFSMSGTIPLGSGYTIIKELITETSKYSGWLISKSCTISISSEVSVISKASFPFATYFSIGDAVMIDSNFNSVGIVRSVTTGSMTLETNAVGGILAVGDVYKVLEGGIPIETLIQNTIDDRLGAGVFTVNLATLGGGNLLVNYTEIYAKWWDNQTCFSFAWFLVGQHGQFFGFRYVDEANPNQLQILKIDRTKTTADRSMSFKGDFYRQDITDSDNAYRDGVLVYYYNIANDAVEQVLSPSGTALEDFDYLMIITENNTAGLNTETEAQNFADNVYSDVQDTFIQQTRLEMPLDDEAELFELVEYENFYLMPDKEKFATDSIKNDYLNNRTTKSASNRIRGSIKSAQAKEIRPGQEEQVNDKKLTSESKIAAPKGLEVLNNVYNIESLGQVVTTTIELKWLRPRGFNPANYQIEIKKTADSWGTTGVTKYQTTETSIKIPVEDRTDYDIRVVGIDKNNQIGIYSSELEFLGTSISSESKVFQIRSQEQWEDWIENYLYREDVGITVDYNTIDIYKGNYTYTMESWFETSRLGEVKTGLLNKIYITNGDVSLFEVNDYVRLNSEIRQISAIDTVNDILTVSSAFSGVYAAGVFEYQNTFLGFSADTDITFRGIGEVVLDITLKRVWDGTGYGNPQYFIVFQSDTVIFNNIDAIYRNDSTALGTSQNYLYAIQSVNKETGITGTISATSSVISVVAGDESDLNVGETISIGGYIEEIISIDTVAHTITLRKPTDTTIGSATDVLLSTQGRIEFIDSKVTVAEDTTDTNTSGLLVVSSGAKSLNISRSHFDGFQNVGLTILGSYSGGKSGTDIELDNCNFGTSVGATQSYIANIQASFDKLKINENRIRNTGIQISNTSVDVTEDITGVEITKNIFSRTRDDLRSRTLINIPSTKTKKNFKINENIVETFNTSNYAKDFILCVTNTYNVVYAAGVACAVGSDLLTMASTAGLSAGQVIYYIGRFFTIHQIVSGTQIRMYVDMDQAGSFTLYTANATGRSLDYSYVKDNLGNHQITGTEVVQTFIDDTTGTNLTVSNNFSE